MEAACFFKMSLSVTILRSQNLETENGKCYEHIVQERTEYRECDCENGWAGLETYKGHPESKDRLAIKKNKQNKNLKEVNVTLLHTRSYFST
jgi:hypothetical protein